MEGGGLSEDEVALLLLPPGFRFHPTDEEIIMHYLLKKVMDRRFRATAIVEADLNKCEPWDLPNKAKQNTSEKEWYLFFQRDRKYPTGMRTNRATESGYWKATGKDKEIKSSTKPVVVVVGMKKTLVFYKGRAPKGEKTNWVMHEYRLNADAQFSNYNISRAAKEEFVVCRVFHKNSSSSSSSGIRNIPTTTAAGFQLSRFYDDSFLLADCPTTLPPLTDYSCSSNIHSNSPGTHHDQHESNGHNIINPSRSHFSSYHNSQYELENLFVPHYTNVDPFPCLHNSVPIPNFHPQLALPTSMFSYQPQTLLGYQQSRGGLGSMISSYPTNDRENSSVVVVAPEMEHFSSNNSVISQSQETGLCTESLANEITSLPSKGDVESSIKKPFDDHELDGLAFSPDISDLDSLWSY